MKDRKLWIILSAAALIAIAVAAVLLLTKCRGPHKEPETVVVTADPTEAAAISSDTEAPTEAQTDSPAPTNTPEPFTVSARSNDGFVRACATGTYGVASDGSVRFMGRSVSGQHLISGWSNVIDLELNDSTTAALRRDGTVLITGAQKGAFAEASEWTGIVDIAMGDDHLAGLRTDGTVVVCGQSSGETADWTGVGRIAAADGFTVGLTEAGVVATLGTDANASLAELGPAADISAAPGRIALLTNDGRVKLAEVEGNGVTVSDPGWERIVKVFAAEGALYAIDDSGRLLTDAPFVDEQIDDAYCVAASGKHAVVLHSNGKCTGFGENEDMQCGVGGWRLLPFITDEGWLLGFGPGTYVGGEAVHTGLETVYTDPSTGAQRDATFVILGDVNGDSKIDPQDVSAVKAHISGEKKLSGAYLRAANIIDDSSRPGAVDSIDLRRLSDSLNGGRSIDQYAKTDKYTAPLANAQRKNGDALGYIKIRNTNIDYPIMYGSNWYYNDHDSDKNSAVRGSIYFYWPAASGNIVITGHNSRTSGTMFHQLHKVQNNAGSLKSYSDRLWAINTYGQTGYWEVWAMYEEGAFRDASMSSQLYNTCWSSGYDSKSEQEKQAWIDYQLRRNKLGYTVSVTTQDRFMTLVTCGDTHADAAKGSRLYFFLRWVGND